MTLLQKPKIAKKIFYSLQLNTQQQTCLLDCVFSLTKKQFFFACCEFVNM
jgi:hypothetical protein